MKRIPFIIGLILVALMQIQGQAQQKFSYQAALRNADGTVLANQTVDILISILPTATPNVGVIYSEEHSYEIKNGMGIVSLKIGTGTVKSGAFATIPWGDDVFIQVDVKKAGGAYQLVGTSQILSVPYAIQAGTVKEVKSLNSAEDAIFEVKNSDGFVVFGVYQGGVRMYVAPPSTSKGAKGGFAVGGISSSKGIDEYLSIYPDSARISFNEATTAKGAKGGFAVGGISSSKSGASNDLFKVTTDSTYFSTTISTTANIITTGNINYGGTVAYDPTLSDTIVDIEGNSYKIVNIGKQTWMKENLRTIHYADNTFIPQTQRMVYNSPDTTLNLNIYGRLYTQDAVLAGNVCPDGWHLPTTLDWQTLFETVGGADWATLLTGLMLMETGTVANLTGYWEVANNASNSSGFSGRPGGGYLNFDGYYFGDKGYATYWWSSPDTPEYINLDGSTGTVSINSGFYGEAYYIRCVK